MIEWMLGQNLPPEFKNRTKYPPKQSKRLFKLEVSRDDADDSDTVSVTYPLRDRTKKKKKSATAAAKQVRFEEEVWEKLSHITLRSIR